MAGKQILIADVVVGRRLRGLGDVSQLAASIADVGLLQPIVVTDERRLVAGRHRLQACKTLGWTSIPATIVSLSDLDRRLAEIDENLIRNELSVLERAEHLAERKRIYEARHPETKSTKNGGPGWKKGVIADSATTPAPRFTADAAAKMNLAERQIQEEVALAGALSRQVRDVIRNTPVADNKEELKRLAKLPDADQPKAAQALADGKAKGVSDWRLQRRYEARRAAALEDVDGRFDVLVADPPWRYRNTGVRGAVKDQYPTMDMDELRALPVADRSADSAVLFLWVTNPLLPDGLALMASWGFAYKTNLAWVKERHTGAPFYVNGQHELVLLGVRGGGMLADGTRPSSVLRADNPEHSRKPDAFYALVEGMYPGLRYLELFARRPRDGWTTWGNES